MITLEIPESQLIDWVQKLGPSNKRALLLALIPTLDEYETLIAYGNERVRTVAARRGLDWDSLDDHQREQLVDDILHQHG